MCTKCLEVKDFSKFVKNSKLKSGIGSCCQSCNYLLYTKKRAIDNSRTYKGRILRMWYNILMRCKHKLKTTKVLFSKGEFIQFIDKKTNYKEVYKKWVENDFVYRLTPIPDRIDSKGHYEASNIQVISFADNTAKANSDNPPRKICKLCKKYIKRSKNISCTHCNKIKLTTLTPPQA